jgi:hypothetical protein
MEGTQFPDDPIFFPLHDSARDGGFIIVSAQMQQPMNQISHQFLLPEGSKFAGLIHGHRHADEDFSMNGIAAAAMVEGDDISGAFMGEEFTIDPRHLFPSDQMNAEIADSGRDDFLHGIEGDTPEEPCVDLPIALPVAQDQVAHSNWERCCS